jgi:hypothetical protein
MPPAKLKPEIQEIDRGQTYSLDRTATAIGYNNNDNDDNNNNLLLLLLPRTELNNWMFMFKGVGVKRKALSTLAHVLTAGLVI